MPQETRRRSARRPAASACAVAIAAGLSLPSPPPQPSDSPHWPINYVVLSKHLGYVYSSDSPRFVYLAREPWHLLDRREGRQSRPLYIVTASMLRACLAPLFPEHPKGILLLDPAYTAFVVADFVVLWMAMLAFQGLFPDPAWPFGVFAISSLLVANDVVKVFFWTPHTQMFNVLAPVVALLSCRWLLSHPAIRPRTLLILGMGLGALTLFALLGTYAPRLSWNLVPPVLAVAAAIGSTLRSRVRPAAGRVLDASVTLAVVAWFGFTVAKRGPWL